MRARRPRGLVLVYLVGDPDHRLHIDVPTLGVWSLVRYDGGGAWAVVHRPSGRTLCQMRSAELALVMLDALGASVPNFADGMRWGGEVETTSDESHHTRRVVLETQAAYDAHEDMYWPEWMR